MSTKFFETKKAGGSKPQKKPIKIAIISAIAVCLTVGAGFGAYKLVQSGLDSNTSSTAERSNTKGFPIQSSSTGQYQPRNQFDNLGVQNSSDKKSENRSKNQTNKVAQKSKNGKKQNKHAKHKSSKHSKKYAKNSKKKHGKHLAKYSKKNKHKKVAKKSKKPKSQHHRELAAQR